MTEYTKNILKTQVFLLDDFKKMISPTQIIMGIDYGAKRIGLALSDKNKQMATPFKVIHQLKELDDIIPAKNVGGFVIGLPLQPDGTPGDMVHQVNLFANRLIEKYNLPICFIDERLTSKQAEHFMNAIGMRQKKQRQTIDTQAAVIILQKCLPF